MAKFVYAFEEGNKDQKDLLGGKGANLAEMTRLGLPVPPGFTITTEACVEYLKRGAAPAELDVQVTAALRDLEDKMLETHLDTNREDLVGIFRQYGSVIKEADEWRPLVDHIVSLVRLAVERERIYCDVWGHQKG